MEGFQTCYDRFRDEVETYLRTLLPSGGRPYGRLQEAMGYSLLAGGKRVRPVLALAFCDALGGDRTLALPLGCALELVHTYSLIHDDLPCMDDDDLRRGRPTCHKVYGEAMALLAGDALQAEAFRLIASAEGLSGEQRSDAVLALAAACGADGMVAGQVLDVYQLSDGIEGLRQLCSLKTGALLGAAAALGCIAANASQEARQQIRDDMLDVIADQDEFGKPVGSDRAEGKRTFVDLLGLDGCADLVEQETAAAKAAVASFPHNAFLLELAVQLADRRK